MLLLLALLAASDGSILEARLEAAVDERGDVPVRIAYRIQAPNDPANEAAPVTFSVLEIDGVAIEEVSASAAGTTVEVDLAPRSSPKREGSFLLPRGVDSFELRYLVRRGAERTPAGVRVRLPCPILGLRLEETRTGLFSSTVTLPAGFEVVDGYPAQSVKGAGGAYQWELPLVPAFLSFRASSGGALLTLPRLSTFAVLVLLVAVGVVGVRRVRTLHP